MKYKLIYQTYEAGEVQDHDLLEEIINKKLEAWEVEKDGKRFIIKFEVIPINE